MTSRGTPNAQNTQMLNGVNVNDPAAQGFSMIYYTPSTFENIQVSSGAQDISVGTGGHLHQHGDQERHQPVRRRGAADLPGQETQWDNIDDELKEAGFRPEADAVDFITNTNFQVGGPLLQNQLFYLRFGQLPGHARERARLPGGVAAAYPGRSPTRASRTRRPSAPLRQSSPTSSSTANRFEGYLEHQQYDKPNRGASASIDPGLELEGVRHFVIAQLAWNSVLTDRMFVDTKVSYNNTNFPLYQKTDLQPLTDAVDGHLAVATGTARAIMFRRRLQVVVELDVLRAVVPRRPARVQVRLRQRLHAGGRGHLSRRQRESHVSQRSRHTRPARSACRSSTRRCTTSAPS